MMAGEETETETSNTKKINGNDASSSFTPPSMNTTAFSDFVETMQTKASELQDRVENIDSDKLLADAVDSSKGLMDNFLAGDWLNRGELYGALQIVLIFFLFNKPSSIDALVSLITGPLLVVAGAGISGKALWDLGLKQISIWPAPVPEGSLKVEGLYEYVRHPVYSGLLVSSFGFAVATGSPARLAIAVGLAVLIAKKIVVEEEFLMVAYNDDYADYKDKVPFKLVPKVF